MTQKSVGFKMGITIATVHLLLVVLAYIAAITSRDAQAGLVFIPFLILDAPVLLVTTLLPSVFGPGMGSPLIVFGVMGSLLWFALPWLADRFAMRIIPNARRMTRWIVVVACLPVFVAGFNFLSHRVIALSKSQKRPAELKALLARPAAGALAKRTVLEEKSLGGVCSISLAQGVSDAAAEILVAFHRGAIRLDNRYAVKERVEFSTNHFITVEPVRIGEGFSGRFIVYKHFEYAALLGPDGKEIWRAGESVEPGLHLDGVQCGDIDGDGNLEFAIYYRYREGITLLDDAGQTRWKHTVYALGHIEMADVRGNGKKEILFSNSNNANKSTVFTTVDARGTGVNRLQVSTDSYEFSLVDWPGRPGRPNILLTEENQIRIVDLVGNEVRRLEAPGCRSYGAVKAVPVKFRGDAPEFLAVRKILHPDLAVLFIYDGEGKLVCQDAEIRRGSMQPALAAVPGEEPGTERLLVGSGDSFGARIVEYRLD